MTGPAQPGVNIFSVQQLVEHRLQLEKAFRVHVDDSRKVVSGNDCPVNFTPQNGIVVIIVAIPCVAAIIIDL